MEEKPSWLLFVDDDDDLRDMLIDRVYDAFGSRVRIAEAVDGMEATRKLGCQKFDLIITDLNMPRRNGTDFINWVKEGSPENKATPIVVLTGYPDPHLVEDHENVILKEKPISPDALVELISIQLNLGRLDERVAAELVRFFVESTTTFFNSVLETEVEPLKPAPKKANDDLFGDYVTSVSLKSEDIQYTMALGFEASLVEKLAEIAGGSIDDPEKIIIPAINVVFKQAAKMHKSTKGNLPLLDEKHFFSEKTSFEYKEVARQRGIYLPIQTKWGKVITYGLNEQKARKKMSATTTKSAA